MFKRAATVGFQAGLLMMALVCVGASWAQTAQPLSDAELKERGARLIANQHKNDDALDQYERIEHEVETSGGTSPHTLEDKITRVVPNGAGTTKLLLKEKGVAVSPSDYRQELETWVGVLQFMVNPNDDRMKTATAKYTKREQTRTQLVEAMMNAFVAKWTGRQMLNGHDCDVITLDPNPNFHPRSLFESGLPHAKVTIYVDHAADQLVRGQALITSDISVGAGVLGKLYKGGTFMMDQSEVAPGVWLPTTYRYDFSGRKFLFSFEDHQVIDASHYRHIGTAKDALAIAQNELSTGKPAADDP